MREARVGHAQVGDGGAEGGISDRYTDHQAEREDAVDDALAELGALGEFGVEMERLWVVCECAKDQVVSFRDRARDWVLEHLAGFEFLEIKSGHFIPAP